jgi:DNA-binding CsgD family transcriptional regulator
MEGGGSSIVGRDREHRRLVAEIEADRAVAVVGEAGIGKTSLVRTAAATAGRRLYEGGGFATLHESPRLALRRAIDDPLTGDDATVAVAIEARVGPDLLFIDDLQWADRSTIAVLRLLGGRIGVLVAIRLGDPGTAGALTVARELGATEIDLAGLDTDDARAVARLARPDLAPTELERVVSRAGGNPLLLAEIASRGEPSLALARSIHAGLEHLSTAARETLELLALIDRPIDRRRLGEALAEPGLATFLTERHGQVEIRHALIAEAIRDDLDATRRRAIHRRASDLVTDPAEAAVHLANAGLPDRAAATASAALAGAADPTARARLLVVIAEAAGPDGDSGSRLTAAGALAAVSDWDGIVRLLERDEVAGGPDERAQRQAALVHALFSVGRHRDARTELDRPTHPELDPSGPGAARLAIERAAFRVNVDGQLRPAIDDLSATLERLPPDRPDHHAVRAIVESMRMLAVLPVDIDYLRGAVDGALAAGQFAVAADLARVVNIALIIWHSPEAATSFVDAIGGRLEAVGAHGAAAECRAEAVQACLLAGRPGEAVTRADELLELPASIRARQTTGIFRARALGAMGHLEAASASLESIEGWVTADFIGRGLLLTVQADVALWGGLSGRAVALADAVCGIPSPTLGAYTPAELTRAWSQIDLGLPPQPASGIIRAPTQVGAVSEMAAIERLHARDLLDAARLFADAAQDWAGHDAIRELWCLWAEGDALRGAGDVERAIERLHGALEAATARQIEVVAVRIRRSLRLAGRRLPTERTVGTTGLGLTTREREIVDLAGRGLTNAEIARRIGLGRPTVARILSNAMDKLGAESRGQAVSRIVELHDAPP